MKKHLNLLFVVLFTTLTFAFAACGDDKDEPDNRNNSSSNNSSPNNSSPQKENFLTINGIDYEAGFRWSKIYRRWDDSIAFEAEFTVYEADNYILYTDDFGFRIENWNRVQTGTTFYPETQDDNCFEVYFNSPCQHFAYNLSAGSIEIISLDNSNKKLVIKFNEATYTCSENCELGGPKPLKVNGTLDFTYD